MCQRNNLDQEIAQFKIIHLGIFENAPFLICYFVRILRAVLWAFTYNLKKDYSDSSQVILYSATEFWMDSFSGLILKLRYREITWIATWFQTAPNPLKGFAEGKREEKYRLPSFLYWFSQLPVKPIFVHLADFVLVNNEGERKEFKELNKKDKVLVVLGAVNVREIDAWKKKHPQKLKKYDAVFQGRFHAQKGVVELIEIWRKVVNKNPAAQLAMIGDGPLMNSVMLKIKSLKLERNIELLGYVFDGDIKYKTFQQSRLVLHPALYDSGGMAASEAMAFDLPVVGFNLKSYESYYPRGMLKVKIGDLEGFSKAILLLLSNKQKYIKLQKEATELIHNDWNWEKRAKDILSSVQNFSK